MRISLCRCDRMESFIKYSVQANVWVFTIALKNSVWLGIHLFIFLQSQEQEKGSQLAEYAFTLSWATKSSAASINVKGFLREEKKTKKTHSLINARLHKSEWAQKKAPDTESINLLFVSIFPHCSYRFILASVFFSPFGCAKMLEKRTTWGTKLTNTCNKE